MELVTALVAAAFSAVLGWVAARAQFRREVAASRVDKELDVRLQLDISNYFRLRDLAAEVRGDLAETAHEARRTLDKPAEAHRTRAAAHIDNVRRVARSSAPDLGQQICDRITSITDEWRAFFASSAPNHTWAEQLWEESRALIRDADRLVIVMERKLRGVVGSHEAGVSVGEFPIWSVQNPELP